MNIKLHKQATTTPKIRADTRAASLSITDSELTRQFSVFPSTIRRWRYRDDAYDRPHTRHNLLATLTTEHEEVLVAAREFLRLGLDDLLVVAREFLNSLLCLAPPCIICSSEVRCRHSRNWHNRTPAAKRSLDISPAYS